MARNPIDTINQANSELSRTGASSLDRAIGVVEGVVKDIYTIGAAASGAIQAESAIYETHTSTRDLREQSLSTIAKYGTPDQQAEAEAIQSKLSWESTSTSKLAALANKAVRNVDPTRQDPATSSTPSSAKQIGKAGLAGARQYDYDGPCPTMTTGGKDRLARDGSRCGRRAASVRPGGWWK